MSDKVYLDMNGHQINVGDYVLIASSVDDQDGWKNKWSPRMDSHVGQGPFLVEYISSTGVRFPAGSCEAASYGWPWGALSIAKKGDKPKPVNKVKYKAYHMGILVDIHEFPDTLTDKQRLANANPNGLDNFELVAMDEEKAASV